MKIASAILCVGLCFYSAYRAKNKLEPDGLATIFAVIAAVVTLI